MSSIYMNDERFDGLYLNVAQTTKGIEPLLDTVFSFLRRKTDFFAGPPGSGDEGTQRAIAKVNEVLNTHAELYAKDNAKKNAQKEVKKSKPKQKKDDAIKKKKSPEEPKKKEKEEEDIIELGSDGFDVTDTAEASTKKKDEHVAKKPDEDNKKTGGNEDDDEDDDSGPPPIGNGGTVDGKYVWTQTLSELNLITSLPENTRGRDLNVDIRKNHLKIGLKSEAPKLIVDDDLTKTVIVDDSFWTIEDGNKLSINLQKLNQMEWWDSPCKSDSKIDVRKVQPDFD
eukprot:CAMPEP_0195539718 /NCGR_PEP_ID=MMETSP0794_2-20130614/50199_1 /TAXON_ID=515487 /ORGANISM="Stephanopyxis turris, Strain CCMP 815" /LENGTH=282 /DNA_ID=CAMNT_0040673765 /DNA_START=132 /DNA_END=980 /DNA_ORIENTATION=-